MGEILTRTSDHFLLIGYALFFLSLFSMIALRRGYFSFPERHEKWTPLPWYVPLVGFLIYLSIQLLVPFLAIGLGFGLEKRRLANRNDFYIPLEFQGWVTFFSVLIAAGVVVLFCFFLTPSLRSTIWSRGKRSPKKIQNALGMGILTWLISFPSVVFVGQGVSLLIDLLFQVQSKPIEQSAVIYLKALMEYPVLFWCTAFLLVFVIPLAEELLFRGFIQTWLLKYVSKIKSIMITSLLFSFLHFSSDQGTANAEFLTSLFVLSCFLGFIYEREGSLWASISLHTTFNGLSVFLILAREFWAV